MNLINKRLRKKFARQNYSSYIPDFHLPSLDEYSFWVPNNIDDTNNNVITEFLNNMSEEECIDALNDIGLSSNDIDNNDKILQTLSEYKSNFPSSWVNARSKLTRWYHIELAAINNEYITGHDYIGLVSDFKNLPKCLNAIMKQVKVKAKQNDNFSVNDYKDIINRNIDLYLYNLQLDWNAFYFNVLESAMLQALTDEHLY